MNVVAFPGPTGSASLAQAILQARDPEVLKEIKKDGIAATIWQRERAAAFADWVNALPVEHLPELRSLVGVDALEGCVHAACDLAGTPRGTERDMLAGDVAALGFMVAKVFDTPLLHVRLQVVTTNACRRFHIDNVTARLICTYRGTGTQLATEGSEDRPTSVSTGSVLLLRGTRWPGAEATGLLHRSPPIEGTGETRLLLVVDPGFDHKAGDHHL